VKKLESEFQKNLYYVAGIAITFAVIMVCVYSSKQSSVTCKDAPQWEFNM